MDLSNCNIYIGGRRVSDIYIGGRRVDYNSSKSIPSQGIRYIRDWIKTNNHNQGRRWIECQALMSDGKNVALGKPVSITPGYYTTLQSALYNFTDGMYAETNSSSIVSVGPENNSWCYLEVDLEGLYKPSSINIWHDYTIEDTMYETKLEVSNDGVTWYTIYDSSVNGEYVETIYGKNHSLPYDGNEVYNTNKIRYIRDWILNNNVNSDRRWVEISAINSRGINVALGKAVTASTSHVVSGRLNSITDGFINTSDSVELTPSNNTWAYLEIDLGAVHEDIVEIKVWHYFSDGRRYTSRLTVSESKDRWLPVYNSIIDGSYIETPKGRTHKIQDIPNADMQIKGVRYIKDWVLRNNVDFSRSWIEIKAIDDLGVNVAYKMPVTIGPSGYHVADSLFESNITDGSTIAANAISVIPADGTWTYALVDLGKVYTNIREITIWHSISNSLYYTSKLEVSDNNQRWLTVYETTVDGQITERAAGITHQLPSFNNL